MTLVSYVEGGTGIRRRAGKRANFPGTSNFARLLQLKDFSLALFCMPVAVQPYSKHRKLGAPAEADIIASSLPASCAATCMPLGPKFDQVVTLVSMFGTSHYETTTFNL